MGCPAQKTGRESHHPHDTLHGRGRSTGRPQGHPVARSCQVLRFQHVSRDSFIPFHISFRFHIRFRLSSFILQRTCFKEDTRPCQGNHQCTACISVEETRHIVGGAKLLSLARWNRMCFVAKTNARCLISSWLYELIVCWHCLRCVGS